MESMQGNDSTSEPERTPPLKFQFGALREELTEILNQLPDNDLLMILTLVRRLASTNSRTANDE